MTIELINTNEYQDYAYTSYSFDIMADGVYVGSCSVLDDGEAYCDRIDIDEEYRNHGYGTAALYELSDRFGGIMVAPDNEDAQRLYERIGRESRNSSAVYFDQGYGVYDI